MIGAEQGWHWGWIPQGSLLPSPVLQSCRLLGRPDHRRFAPRASAPAPYQGRGKGPKGQEKDKGFGKGTGKGKHKGKNKSEDRNTSNWDPYANLRPWGDVSVGKRPLWCAPTWNCPTIFRSLSSRTLCLSSGGGNAAIVVRPPFQDLGSTCPFGTVGRTWVGKRPLWSAPIRVAPDRLFVPFLASSLSCSVIGWDSGHCGAPPSFNYIDLLFLHLIVIWHIASLSFLPRLRTLRSLLWTLKSLTLRPDSFSKTSCISLRSFTISLACHLCFGCPTTRKVSSSLYSNFCPLHYIGCSTGKIQSLNIGYPCHGYLGFPSGTPLFPHVVLYRHYSLSNGFLDLNVQTTCCDFLHHGNANGYRDSGHFGAPPCRILYDSSLPRTSITSITPANALSVCGISTPPWLSCDAWVRRHSSTDSGRFFVFDTTRPRR